MGYLGATLTQPFTRARRAAVSLRDVTIAQMGNGASKCERRHAPEARGGFWDFKKVSQLSWNLPRKKMVGFRLLAEAKPVAFVADAARDGAGRWKSQNRKNVYLSPYVEETLNSKVIKGFVPELRSHYMFFEFRDSYVLSLWTFDVRFTHSRMWQWYTRRTLLEKQRRAHKWCTPMAPHIWPSKSRTTSANIHTAAMWGYGM